MNFLKKMPIKAQLTVLAASTIAFVLITMCVIYFQVVGLITENNDNYTKEMTSQIKEEILSNCKLFNRVLQNITYNTMIQDYIMEPDIKVRFKNIKTIQNFLGNLQEIQDDIVDIALLGENDNSYFQKGQSESANKKIISGIKGKLTNYYTGQVDIEYNLKVQPCFFVISTVYSTNTSKMLFDRIGTVALIVDSKALGLKAHELTNKSLTRFYLIDRNNNVYSSNDSSAVLSEPELVRTYKDKMSGHYIAELENENYIINIDSIPEINGKIISITPEKDLLSGINDTQKLVLVIFIISLALLSIPFFTIIYNILNPLGKFMKFMSKIKNGNLKGLRKRIELEGYYEMGIVAQEFNGMMDEIDNLTHRLVDTSTRLYESELLSRQSELAFLQSQINPHFLYNTLESIRGIAIVRGVDEISETVADLGQILRYSIKGEDIVTVEDELNIVKSYTHIQQTRFTDRIEAYFDFTDEVLKCKILKMVLQPIIENAVYHGLEPKLGKGRLWVSGHVINGSDVVIVVKDDGVGISEDKLKDIHSKLSVEKEYKHTENGKGMSIGVINVNNRIKLSYGSNYGITISSALNKGTSVALRIPREVETDC